MFVFCESYFYVVREIRKNRFSSKIADLDCFASTMLKCRFRFRQRSDDFQRYLSSGHFSLRKMNTKLTPTVLLRSIFLDNFMEKITPFEKCLLKLSDLYIKIESYLWQIWDNHTKAVNLLKWIKDLKLGGPFILDFARLRLAACCQGPPHLHIKNTGSQRRSMQYGSTAV